MRFRLLAKRPIRWALAQAGYDVISRNRYGHNAFMDIERLSQAWKYSLDVFFDVGANEGQTIRHARRRFRDCRIVAFEPHPKTFMLLTENMRKIRNIELVNFALGSEIADLPMVEYDDSTFNSLLVNSQSSARFGKKCRQIQVRCTTVDRFCSERGINQIDVLKIDAEGFEFEVVKGANSMLAQHAIRFIYFEFNEISPRNGVSGGALAPIDQLIRPLGYRFIASYNDYVIPDGELFMGSNALYALPPAARQT